MYGNDEIVKNGNKLRKNNALKWIKPEESGK